MDIGSEQLNTGETQPMKNIAKNQAAVKEVIESLRTSIHGQIITPSDNGYDQARGLFYGGFDKHPAVIVKVSDVQDIATTISTARQSGLELSVRSGGHSVVGYSVSDGGIVLDLEKMKGMKIDPSGKTAWAETGLRAGEYTEQAAAHDLATGFGDTATVGLGGITLGGGVGYLVRKHGLTIDNLLSAEIVTADGQVHLIDQTHEPDLFWAIRGGGGNFGVISRFQFRLHPLGSALGGMLVLPATPEVLANVIHEVHQAPEELSAIVNVMPAPPMPFLPEPLHGKVILMVMLFYAGIDEKAHQSIERIRKLAQPLADMVRPMKYPEMFPPEEGGYHPTAVSRNMFMDEINRDKAAEMLDFLQTSDAPFRVAQLRPLGGAYARVPADATAYAHRDSRNMVNLAAFFTGPDDKQPKAEWLQRFAESMQQNDSGSYVNFMEEVGEERLKLAYPGNTWNRLQTIKARYDPENLFCLNQNIPPAKGLQ